MRLVLYVQYAYVQYLLCLTRLAKTQDSYLALDKDVLSMTTVTRQRKGHSECGYQDVLVLFCVCLQDCMHRGLLGSSIFSSEDELGGE